MNTSRNLYDLVELQKFIENAFEEKHGTLKRKIRKAKIVSMRSIFCVIANEVARAGRTETGKFLGINHTSVIYHLKNFEYRYRFYPEHRTYFNKILEHFKINISC